MCVFPFLQIADVVNRLTVTLPRPRDGKVRAPCIPASVVAARTAWGETGIASLKHRSEELSMEDDGYDSSEGADMRRAGRKLAKEIELANGTLAVMCFLCCLGLIS